MYAKYIKRILDCVLSLTALIILSPLLLMFMVVGAVAMKGNPFFLQKRPGKIVKKTGQEKIFSLIKFRTMSNVRDVNGNLLPDEMRLNAYGRFLRSTSCDELPELINIIKGDMSLVGPRPQLVRDMVFMTEEQRKRHTVRQGLTGLAQVSGRNNISWEKKFEYDLKYIKDITFIGDLKIVFKTIWKVFKRDDVIRDGTVSDIDLGSWLMQNHIISDNEYQNKLEKAKALIKG